MYTSVSTMSASSDILSYSSIFLDLRNGASDGLKVLERLRKSRGIVTTKPTEVTNDELRMLVRLSHARENNVRIRAASACSKCSKECVATRMRCSRWINQISEFDGKQGTGDRKEPLQQSYCEVLGPKLCSDCICQRIKQHHDIQFPRILKVERRLTLNQKSQSKTEEANDEHLVSRSDGYTARANTPNQIPSGNSTPFWDKDTDQIRTDLKRLSSLTVNIKVRRKLYKTWLDRVQQSESREEPKRISQSVTPISRGYSLSVSSYDDYATFDPGKIKVPCNTPEEKYKLLPQQTRRRNIDVIVLAKRLNELFQERYLPPVVTRRSSESSVNSILSTIIGQKSNTLDYIYEDSFETGVSGKEDEEEATGKAQMLDGTENDNLISYRKLSFGPPKLDTKKALITKT